MRDTAFLRSDELPARAALGYLTVHSVWRTNVFHLPVRGSGDDGIYSTVAERSLRKAFLAGSIVSPGWDERDGASAERCAVAVDALPPRLLAARVQRHLTLEGMDARVMFRSVHDPGSDATHSLISNSTDST